jgi:glucosamine-6-phosphate deaminase
MKVIKVQDYAELSRTAAEIIIEKVNLLEKMNLGLATGSTPLGLYQNLAADYQINKTTYQHVTTFNLDEYVGLYPNNKNSYHYFMNEHLFNHIDILRENINIPIGFAEGLDEECLRYEVSIENNGGIDLQVLGLGKNGHIGFNEPGTSFQSGTHVVELDDSTREANSRFFDSVNEVPKHAITMGIASIFKSKEILLLVSGEQKATAVQRLIHGEISEDFPASILMNHPYVTLIIDSSAFYEGND